jgi:hypothetical protein
MAPPGVVTADREGRPSHSGASPVDPQIRSIGVRLGGLGSYFTRLIDIDFLSGHSNMMLTDIVNGRLNVSGPSGEQIGKIVLTV